MQSFNERPSVPVTLRSPSGQSITLHVFANSISTDMQLEMDWPKDDGLTPRRRSHLQAMVRLADALQKESMPHRVEGEDLPTYGARIERVFDSAGYTTGHISQLAEALSKVCYATDSLASVGNSSAPPPDPSPTSAS